MKCIRLSIGSEEGKWSLEVLSLWLPRVQPSWSGGEPLPALYLEVPGATVVVLELPHNLDRMHLNLGHVQGPLSHMRGRKGLLIDSAIDKI